MNLQAESIMVGLDGMDKIVGLDGWHYGMDGQIQAEYIMVGLPIF